MEAWPAPGGVDGKVEGKARSFAGVVGDEAFEERLRPETIAAQLSFADLDCVGLTFVDG